MNNTTILISAGVIIMVMLALTMVFFVVFYQRKRNLAQVEQQLKLRDLEADLQKKMLQQALEVQESVRREISKDLHDEVGGLLSAAKMSFFTIEKGLSATDPLNEKIAHSKDLVSESLQLVRNLSKNLVPHTLENFGLLPAIEEYIGKIEFATNIKFNLQAENMSSITRLNTEIELSIYRIIQELINNSIKHSKATTINLLLSKNDKDLIVNFNDNGLGYDFNSSKTTSGLGLNNIKSRIAVINGEIKFDSIKNEITALEIKIPLFEINRDE